jgi:hypothetical protein
VWSGVRKEAEGMRIKVEWQEGQAWRSVLISVAVSRHGNFTFKHDGKVYVFKDKREGEPVLVLQAGHWVKAGRVARACIFLGPGMPSDEYYRTPGALESARVALQSFLVNRERVTKT